VEIHVATRSDLRPDPEFDEIRALFYCVHVDRPTPTEPRDPPAKSRDDAAANEGAVVVSRDRCRLLDMTGVSSSRQLAVTYVDTEVELLSALVSLVTQSVSSFHC